MAEVDVEGVGGQGDSRRAAALGVFEEVADVGAVALVLQGDDLKDPDKADLLVERRDGHAGPIDDDVGIGGCRLPGDDLGEGWGVGKDLHRGRAVGDVPVARLHEIPHVGVDFEPFEAESALAVGLTEPFFFPRHAPEGEQ